MNHLNQLTCLVQYILGLTMLSLALASAYRAQLLKTLWQPLPSSIWGRIACAIVFLLAGLATLAGAFVPFVAFFASCVTLMLTAFLAVCAVRTKLLSSWVLLLFTASASIAIALGQPLGLKVLLLPKADVLPLDLLPYRVVKTYDEGLWFEGIAAGRDGSLYLSGNRGLDFTRGDYYHAAHGEVIVRKPNGEERTLFETPAGSTAGVIAIAADGSIYMSSHGDSPCIWRISLAGASEKLVQLPAGAWPNGLDIGPDEKLYSADSAMGLIWRIDPKSKIVDRVIEDKELLARPYLALAPGANGLHFRGNDLYVTVSDRTTVLRYRLDDAGKFSAAEVVATGVPGDDFAIGQGGALFITTHPYNTIVRVDPDRRRMVIAGAEQHIVGATDAVFGKGTNDRETLYVVTDGGAFTGGPKARGELVALEPTQDKPR